MSLIPNAEPRDARLPGASTQLVESAVDLLRAEARLALAHVRYLAVPAVSALLLVVVGAACLQVTILVCVAAPILASRLLGWQLALAVVTPASLSVAALAVAYKIWDDAQDTGREPELAVRPRKGSV